MEHTGIAAPELHAPGHECNAGAAPRRAARRRAILRLWRGIMAGRGDGRRRTGVDGHDAKPGCICVQRWIQALRGTRNNHDISTVIRIMQMRPPRRPVKPWSRPSKVTKQALCCPTTSDRIHRFHGTRRWWHSEEPECHCTDFWGRYDGRFRKVLCGSKG